MSLVNKFGIRDGIDFAPRTSSTEPPWTHRCAVSLVCEKVPCCAVFPVMLVFYPRPSTTQVFRWRVQLAQRHGQKH